MHACLSVDEIIRFLAHGLVASGGRATAVALAGCCKRFEDPVLDVLWREQGLFYPLLDTLPESVWDEASEALVSSLPTGSFLSAQMLAVKTFKRAPTTVEWARFKKYARRMRELKLDLSEEPISSHILSVLQLHTLNEPLLPNLKVLELKGTTSDIIPFIPLFLSHRTTHIDIQFSIYIILPTVMLASMIINLPKLCPDIQSIALSPLPRGSAITNATSEMLLACNPDALQNFQVDSALTEEANRVLFQLPNLRSLWTVFAEPIPLPDVSLPNLTDLDIEYYHDHYWLRAFQAAKFSRLAGVTFRVECNRIGNLLETFESTALATSAFSTISYFAIYASCPWNPSYHSLLAFRQLAELVLEFSCHNGCSSRIDDDTVISLAQSMPKLEVLQIGKTPCQAPGNVTIRGLIALAYHCPGLSTLRIHFQTDSLIVEVANEAGRPLPESYIPRHVCALTTLEVGEIPIQPQNAFFVLFPLLRIFPHLRDIEYVDENWKWIAEIVGLCRQTDSLVHRTGK